MAHRIEIYMDSYSNTPIVQETDQKLSISIGDELSHEDWPAAMEDPRGELRLKVRVTDVRHQFWDAEDIVHAISIKVVPAE